MRGPGRVLGERTQHMRVECSNRSGIQLREPSDSQPEQWFVRLPFGVDDPCDVQGVHVWKRRLVSEVRWEDIICVVIDDRYRDSRVRQPDLRPVVSSR